jgi:hypothetical protein
MLAAEASLHERSVPMPPVVLINPFEVPEGKDETFLAEWEMAKAFMERQPGYISTRLHRSLAPNARFRFINVAEWASVEDFQTALNPPSLFSFGRQPPFRIFLRSMR